MKINLRRIKKEDNKQLKDILIEVLNEFEVPEEGTALGDDELNYMFESYNKKRHIYYVLEINDVIMGGAGIAPLKNSKKNICELQKMYFHKKARGKGLGKKMIQLCVDYAKNNHFELCYIETMPNMISAQKLYTSIGFEYIDKPLGNTGHSSCPVWMIKTL